MYENIIDIFQNNNSYLSKQLLEILWDLHERIRFVRQRIILTSQPHKS